VNRRAGRRGSIFDHRLLLGFSFCDFQWRIAARWRTVRRCCLRGYAAVANPEICEFLEAEGMVT